MEQTVYKYDIVSVKLLVIQYLSLKIAATTDKL